MNHRSSSSSGRRTAPPRRSRGFVRHKRTLIALAILIALVVGLVSLISSCASNKARVRDQEELIAAYEASLSSLRNERDALRSQLENTDTELETEAGAAEDYRTDLDAVIRAMDLFWQIDESYVLSRHTRARELIRSLESQSLAGYLPAESTTDTGRFSPYDRYAEICEALQEPYGNGVKE